MPPNICYTIPPWSSQSASYMPCHRATQATNEQLTELWEIWNSCKSVPNQQGYVDANSRKSVHLNTHAREQLTGCYSKLTEKRAHRTGQGHQGYPKCRYNPSSSPRYPISPSLGSTCASTQPYADIHPLDQGLSKNYAPRGQSPPKVLTSAGPLTPGDCREVNKDLNTRINTPSHIVHRYLFGQ